MVYILAYLFRVSTRINLSGPMMEEVSLKRVSLIKHTYIYISMFNERYLYIGRREGMERWIEWKLFLGEVQLCNAFVMLKATFSKY